MSKKSVTIYTDGACSGNPGPGGWGAILMYGDNKKELSGGEVNTTNNRMELMAAIEGMKALKYPCIVDLYTDSAYLHNAFTNGWVWNWMKSGWKKSDKKPVLNIDLWEELIRLNSLHEITWHKVKGHADNVYNNRCDELARAAIDGVRKNNSPDDKSIKIYIAYEFQNGMGSYVSYLLGNKSHDEFSGSADIELLLICNALTTSLAAVTKPSDICIYSDRDNIKTAISYAKDNADTDNLKRLRDQLNTHNVDIRIVSADDRDQSLISCITAARELFSEKISRYASDNKQLFVKLFFAAEAGSTVGAWYSLITDGKVMSDSYGKYASATQNYLRLSAITESINSLNQPCVIEVYTDSSYIFDSATERLGMWISNNWKKANQLDVSHVELWKMIAELSHRYSIFWHKLEKDENEEHMIRCRQKVASMLK